MCTRLYCVCVCVCVVFECGGARIQLWLMNLFLLEAGGGGG